MSEHRYTLIAPASDAEWDRVVASSPQGTLFAESGYLAALDRPVERRVILQGREVKGALLTLPSAGGDGGCELDDLVIYGGLMFVPEAKRAAVKQRHEEFQLTEFVIPALAAAPCALALSPAVTDLRPFLWYRYHETSGPKFRVDLRYTSIVDLTPLAGAGDAEATETFARMETVRRYSVREARRKGGTCRRATSAGTLIDFYRQLMAAQGDAPSDARLQQMARVLEYLIARDRGAVYEVLDASGAVIYVSAFGWDTRRAYYLFGAGRPGSGDAKAPWQGTLALWAPFVDLARSAGVTEVDLEGVNSPLRGWFKLGFGGSLTPYFHVYL